MINSLSIILPLYNEEKRLIVCLEKVDKFLKNKEIKDLEIIFVNDGSTDNSKEMIQSYIKQNIDQKYKNLILINAKHNFGKGSALKEGVKKATKQWILTSDIDFSVPIDEIINWIQKGYLNKKTNVFFGSRSHSDSIVNSKFYRKVVGSFLRIIISYLLDINIKDTQCGYKLYEKKIAQYIFSNMHSNGFEHDIEIILILKKKGIFIEELPVNWTHVSLSKVNIFSDSFKVLKSVFFLKNKYLN